MEIHVARDGSALGVYSPDEVRSGLADGRFRASDLAWRAGMAAWTPLAEWPEFASVPSAAPTASGFVAPAWERGSSWNSYFSTFADILFRPVRTFDALPRGDVTNALSFQYAASLPAWIFGCCAFSAVFFAISSMGLSTPEMSEFNELGAAGPAMISVGFCAVIGCFAALAPLFTFISAALIHVLILPWSPTGGYAQTYRATGYVQGCFLPFSFIPCLNYLTSIWAGVITVIALSRTHHISWWKVALSLAIPTLIILALALSIAA